MLRFIFRNLLLERFKTLLTCGALGAVIALLLLLEGFERGLEAQLRRVSLDRGADLILVQSGISNLTASRSVLPQLARGAAEEVPGVRAAHPMTGISVIYEQEGRKTPIFLMVYDTFGGPKEMASGSRPSGGRDIVLDASLAKRYGLAPGDSFRVAGFPFRISGFSQGTAALFTPYGYINYDGLIDFYFEADLAEDISAFPLLSFLLVELVPGANPAAVAQALEKAVPEADAVVPEILAANDAMLGTALFGSALGLLKTIGTLIGVLVVAMLLFASIAARQRELGVLKAIGFRNGWLFRLVLSEALLLTTAAIPPGIILAWAVAHLTHWFEPIYLVLPFEPLPFVRALAACAAFAALGALVPARLVSRIDPALVFNP